MSTLLLREMMRRHENGCQPIITCWISTHIHNATSMHHNGKRVHISKQRFTK
uniref:Uncharacterized protein n=1 Tax=Anguilla anguilla TaxID=7936 RepID=A0A0E9X8L3_ANGAN